jgi:hypothetical protein
MQYALGIWFPANISNKKNIRNPFETPFILFSVINNNFYIFGILPMPHCQCHGLNQPAQQIDFDFVLLIPAWMDFGSYGFI